MNLGLNSTVRALTICAIAATLAAVSSRSWASKSSEATSSIELDVYLQADERPTLVLLCDLTSNPSWRDTASNLRSHFDIRFFDSSKFDESSDSLALLHAQIDAFGISNYKISSDGTSESISTGYAAQYSKETNSFILPDNSEDLFELTILFHQLMDTQPTQEHPSES